MNHNQKVKVINTYRDDAPDLTGEIVGMGHVILNGDTHPIYLVKLDQGFWSHDNRVWHSVIPVDRSNLEPIK